MRDPEGLCGTMVAMRMNAWSVGGDGVTTALPTPSRVESSKLSDLGRRAVTAIPSRSVVKCSDAL
ncbi:hypothetical protein [Nocardia sp. NPDC057455]|uniref:hypothetical protein n=1 Tax=Nocardia sp. NPDC057455 TaxID=3346138 RepID=UPI00366F4189